MAFDPAILPTILGIGAKIGTAIPGLKKPKRDTRGSREASKYLHKASAQAAGTAAGGFGASRGLALREGLRAGTEIAREGAAAVGATAFAESQAFEGQKDARNERLGAFGGDLAAGAASMTQALIDPADKKADDSAVGMTRDANSASALTQAEQTLPGAVPDEASNLGTDPETIAIQQEVAAIQQNADMAENDDPRVSGPSADFATTNRLEELRTKAPTVAAPQIEAMLHNRLRAKKLMYQDAERMGMNLESIIPMINTQLSLQPGQSLSNPMGLSLDMNDEHENFKGGE